MAAVAELSAAELLAPHNLLDLLLGLGALGEPVILPVLLEIRPAGTALGVFGNGADLDVGAVAGRQPDAREGVLAGLTGVPVQEHDGSVGVGRLLGNAEHAAAAKERTRAVGEIADRDILNAARAEIFHIGG